MVLLVESSFNCSVGDSRFNQDLDVDGHTNLDNISVAGVSTFSNNVQVGTGITLNKWKCIHWWYNNFSMALNVNGYSDGKLQLTIAQHQILVDKNI